MSDRHPNLFTKNNSCLLLIDYQERFVNVIHEHENTLKKIKFLLNGSDIYNLPVFVSEQIPDKLGQTIAELKELTKKAKYFSKKTMSCCGEADFVYDLKKTGIKKVAICGIEAHVCVLQTTLDLIHNGFQVHVVSDAISVGRDFYNKQIAIEKMRAAGAIISSVETILFEMAYEAGSDEFRKLQALFKN